jgi:hypothetical protein
MNTQQAYISGFVKRAAVYGYTPEQAWSLLKSASPETLAMSPGAMTAAQAANNPVRAVDSALPDGVPVVSLESLDSRNRATPAPAIRPSRVPRPHLDEAKVQPNQRAFNQIR